MTQDDKLRDCLKEECIECSQWLDYCKDKKTSPHWHTGTPIEDGDYVVICQYTMNNYMARTMTIWAFKNGRWDNTLERFFSDFKVIAWYGQRIEPYKEKDELNLSVHKENT